MEEAPAQEGGTSMAIDGKVAVTPAPNTAMVGPCESRCVEDHKREFRKMSYRAMVPGLVVALGQLAVGSSMTIPGLLVALFSGVCVFGLFVILAGRRYIPAIQMMVWTGDRQAEILAEIDGNPESPDGDELLLERVAGRTGSGATFVRITALAGLGRVDEAKALLDEWQPTDPVDVSRHERLAAKIDLDHADEHLARAEAAIATISDPKERISQHATLILDAARVNRRESWPGLEALAASRAELGNLYSSSHPLLKRAYYAVSLRAAWTGAVFAAVSLVISLFTEPSYIDLVVLDVLLATIAVVGIAGILRAPRQAR